MKNYKSLNQLIPPVCRQLEMSVGEKGSFDLGYDVHGPDTVRITFPAGCQREPLIPAGVQFLLDASGADRSGLVQFKIETHDNNFPLARDPDPNAYWHTLVVNCDPQADPAEIERYLEVLETGLRRGRMRGWEPVEGNRDVVDAAGLILEFASVNNPAVDRALSESSAGMFPLRAIAEQMVSASLHANNPLVFQIATAMNELARGRERIESADLLAALDHFHTLSMAVTATDSVQAKVMR